MPESAPLVNSFLLSTVAKASGESGASRLLLTSEPSRPRSEGIVVRALRRELLHRPLRERNLADPHRVWYSATNGMR